MHYCLPYDLSINKDPSKVKEAPLSFSYREIQTQSEIARPRLRCSPLRVRCFPSSALSAAVHRWRCLELDLRSPSSDHRAGAEQAPAIS